MTTKEENDNRSIELPARRSGWPMVVLKCAVLIGLIIGLLV